MKLTHSTLASLAASALLFLASTPALALFDPSFPDEYRGRFRDERTGAQAEIDKKEARFTFAGGTSLQLKTDDLNFKNLKKEKTAALFGEKNDRSKTRDVFVVVPRKGTRKEEAGLIWYSAEIVYLQIDEKMKEPVQYLGLVHAAQGTVLLDTASERFELGWAGGQEDHGAVRQSPAPLP